MDLRLRPRLALTLTSFHCRVRLGKKNIKIQPPPRISTYISPIEPVFSTLGRPPLAENFRIWFGPSGAASRRSKKPTPSDTWSFGTREAPKPIFGHLWFTLWLCQNSHWKWPFIVDFPIKNGDFP
jgi:hypothetical protein